MFNTNKNKYKGIKMFNRLELQGWLAGVMAHVWFNFSPVFGHLKSNEYYFISRAS